MIHPNIQHVRLTTTNFPVMAGWYARIFGMVPRGTSSMPEATKIASRLMAAWSCNHLTNPHITLLALSGQMAGALDSFGSQPQHITFKCAKLDDLLTAYFRLKNLGIEPVAAIDHGATTAFYYEDPDHNLVRLLLDNLSHPPASTSDRHTLLEPKTEPRGVPVDPEKMGSARITGMSVNELHQRAYAGEFPPPKPMAHVGRVHGNTFSEKLGSHHNLQPFNEQCSAIEI